MEALGATEDVAQLKAVLAMSAMAEGRFAEAERILDEIDATTAGIFGAAIIVRCGRPELDLAAGRIEDGLRGYRDAVHELSTRPIPGIGLTLGYEPWMLFPAAAALSAHIRHGHLDDGAPLRAELVAKVPVALDAAIGYLDYPVVGAMLFALAEWELTTATEPGRPRPRRTPARLRRRLRLQPAAAQPQLGAGLAMAEAALPGEVARVRAELGDRKATRAPRRGPRLVTELVGADPGRSRRAVRPVCGG